MMKDLTHLNAAIKSKELAEKQIQEAINTLNSAILNLYKHSQTDYRKEREALDSELGSLTLVMWDIENINL